MRRQSKEMADPEATLYGAGNPEYFDPNATMVGQPGYFDPNATLVGIEVNGVPQMMTARVRDFAVQNRASSLTFARFYRALRAPCRTLL